MKNLQLDVKRNQKQLENVNINIEYKRGGLLARFCKFRGEFLLSFVPDFYFENITEIEIEFLEKNFINAVLLDIDNTLSPHGAEVPYDGVYEWVSKLKNAGIKIAIISNNKKSRVQLFSKKLDLEYYIFDAKKPFRKGFSNGKNLLKTENKNVLVVGDQIFTDVFGANFSDMKSALVEPKDKNEPFGIRIKRFIEKPIRFIIKIKYKKYRRY